MADLTESIDTAIARAFGRARGPADEGDISEAELDSELARIAGREAAAPVESGEARRFREVKESLQRDVEEAETGTPWRIEVPWHLRETFASAEDEYVRLRGSRRGEPAEVARRAAEATLREAWWGAGGVFGVPTIEERTRAVVEKLDAELAHFRAVPSIVPRGETLKERMVRVVPDRTRTIREGGR